MADVVAEVAAPVAPVVEEELTLMTSVQKVLRKALIADGLRRGLHECVKAIAKSARGADGNLVVGPGGARLCCLAADCDEKSYVTLVKALCQEKGVPLVIVPQALTLGEWAGLCKLDAENKPRKIVSTSVCVVTDFGASSRELEFILNELNKKE